MSRAWRTCRNCGDEYEGESWQKLCWRCWRERKERDERDELERREIHARTEARRAGYEQGYAAGVKAARAKSGAGIDAELLRRVITLTHPDRHAGRFEEANEITAKLLILREEIAA